MRGMARILSYVVLVIAVCANNKFQNYVFNPFQVRCQFNWELLSWFKRIKLHISDVLYPVRRIAVCSDRIAMPLDTVHSLRPPLQKLPLESSVVFVPFDCRSLADSVKSTAIRLSERKRLFRLFSSRGVASSSLAFFEIASRAEKWRRKGRSLASAYRTLAAAGAAVDVLRMRKTRKSEVKRAGGDNEIEMAKADHRIGWLNRGWRWRAKQVAQDENEGANPHGYSTVCERARARARVSCSTKLILNRNIFVE